MATVSISKKLFGEFRQRYPADGIIVNDFNTIHQGSVSLNTNAFMTQSEAKRFARPNVAVSSSATLSLQENYLFGFVETLANIAQLEITLPTTVTVDLSLFGFELPEGTNIAINVEQDFVREIGGNQTPVPGQQFLSFRTPKQYETDLDAEFTDNFVPLRIKQLASAIASAGGFVVNAVLAPGNLAGFFAGPFSVSPTANYTASGASANNAVFTRGILAGFLLEDTVAYNTDANIIIDNERARLFSPSLNTVASQQTIPTKTLGPIDIGNSQSQFTQTIENNYVFDPGASIVSSASLICDPVFTTEIFPALQVQATILPITDLTFVMQTNLGGRSSKQISIPVGITNGLRTANTTIHWGDGNTTTTTQDGVYNHTYANHGEYAVRISCNDELEGIGNLSGALPATYTDTIKEIRSWGIHTFADQNGSDLSFYNLCGEISYNAFEVPENLPTGGGNADLRLESMFEGCEANPSNLVNWDLTQYRNVRMTDMFKDAVNFNQPIGVWDVSLTSESASTQPLVFNNTSSFNQDLGNWYNFNNSSNDLATDLFLEIQETGMSEENYNRTLVGFANRTLESETSNWKVIIQVPSSLSETSTVYGSGFFDNGIDAKNWLINNKGWDIQDV